MKTIFYLGLNDKKTKQQEITTINAYKIVQNLALSMFDGVTIQESFGVYKHNDQSITKEKSLVITVFDDQTEQSIKKFANTLKQLFNQESVAVEQVQTNTSFI